MDILRGLLGMTVMLGACYVLSANRKNIDWKLVLSGLGIQFVLAILMLKVPGVKIVFEYIASFFVAILQFTEAGSRFMFGNIIDDMNTFGYIFAFQVLPTIIFFSAFSAILYYLGILQKIIYGFAWVMSKTMRLSGAESLAAAANVFIGQTEAPLVVKPYLDTMTRSEILCLMTGGMATIAGGVFAAYVGYLGGSDPAQQQLFATHLLTASIISAPAAIMVAKMLFPEDTPEKINTNLNLSKDKIGSNLLDAISKGTSDGLKLAVNVGVMLLVFTALVNMANVILMSTIGEWTGLNEYVINATENRFEGFSFTYLLGVIFAPVAWLLGVPAQDTLLIGQLLGQKTMINEFVAYADMGAMRLNPNITLHPKSVLIATYALCGFANFASIGIQIGGIGALAPKQRKVLSEFGIKALIGGTIACFLTAAIAGMLVTDYNIESVAEEEEKTYIAVDELTHSMEFFGTFGNPESSSTVRSSACFVLGNDSTTTQIQYQNNLFEEQGSYIIPKSIDFKTSTQNISIKSENVELNDGLTIDELKATYSDEAAYANIKDGKGKVNMPKKPDGSYYELDFEEGKLIGFKRLYACE
ncbi:MAG: NupC/NupG family nucleoside CNT transporter [Saprospiraceae bacterium]